ncbi:hypothetical protein MBLNU13_g02857t2 [Cladosporium sp. NU13]
MSKESRSLSRPAVMGISIGVSLSAIAIALLLWSARRHRKNTANTAPTVYSPPNSIDRSNIRVIPNADIEATAAFTTNFQNEPIELEGAAVVPADMSYRTSPMREPERASIYSNRVPAITTDNNRWSAVSSLRSFWLPSRLAATRRGSWLLTAALKKSPTDPAEPSIVTVTINNTIPIPSDDDVTPKSPNSSVAAAISTTSDTSSDVATAILAVDTESEPRTSTGSNRPTTIGVSVGVPKGLVSITLLLYVLRRYLKYRGSCTATVSFPPDPIDPFATRISPKIELDALPNAIHELDGTTAPSELENSASAVTDPRRPPSIISELECSPGISSDPGNRASVATTLNDNRWSNAFSLAPSAAHQSSRARPSIAKTLSIVGQQHHGSGQDFFLTPPRPHASHRLSRPTSGLLPQIEVPGDEFPSTTKTGPTTASKQEISDMQELHDGEQAVVAQATHEDEQVPSSDTARTRG